MPLVKCQAMWVEKLLKIKIRHVHVQRDLKIEDAASSRHGLNTLWQEKLFEIW